MLLWHNLIFYFMCDQFRGDCLSYSDTRTPRCKNSLPWQSGCTGRFFDNAYSSCPSCIPARVALFTGKSQEGHGRVSVGWMEIDWNWLNYMMAENSSSNGADRLIGKCMHPAKHWLSRSQTPRYLGHYRGQTFRIIGIRGYRRLSLLL